MNKIAVNPLLALSVVLGTSAIAALPGMAQTEPVIGFNWSITGGPLWSSVGIVNPPNDAIPLNSTFTLKLPGYDDRSLTAGQPPFDLLTVNPSGFSNFSITGIDPALNFTPTSSFKIGVLTIGSGPGPISIKKSPIYQVVPEPSSLLGLGLLGSGAFLKRKLSKKKQDQKKLNKQ